MQKKKRRRCKICNAPLCNHNTANVCFCHKEHPNFSSNFIINHKCPIGCGHSVPGLYVIRKDYYGNPEGED